MTAPGRALPVVDFAGFAEHWNRRPCVVRGLDEFGTVDVYELYARIGAAVRAGTHRRPDDVKLFTAPPGPPDLGRLLPAAAEPDFAGYAARVSAELGRDWSFVLNSAQAFSPELYRLAREVLLRLRGTADGLPAGLSDCFLVGGSYATGPTRIHKDTADVFLYVAQGVKTMLLWPYEVLVDQAPPDSDPEHNFVPLKVTPDEIAAEPLRLTGGPGEVLYWPASYWHCAESDGRPSLSLHLATHRYRDLAPVWAGAFAGAGIGADLPPHWEVSERALGGETLMFGQQTAAAATSAVHQWSLARHSTANFQILPDLSPRSGSEPTARRARAVQRFPVSWAVDAGQPEELIVAANGLSLRVASQPATIELLTALASLEAGAALDLAPWSGPAGLLGDAGTVLAAAHAAGSVTLG
ncbi:hypothetical protein C7C46_04850 [Streptomyces tateyamensis]|uniref:JmjC domain-containing protein n=1 Tax=Streptomyces tateyamensis TaxID=565073 RepID=A0A2V4P9K4_9ACTN|nr:cupin domain-containing protein [Streptomyces tateyamensis]PYC87411.1 hypothetical protein C7C46_04850 [Streptomyces tateyamensis]